MSTAALYVFAFGSGFAALVYQVAWSRMLALTFGSSLLAAGAVVAAFMGGMGIGAWLYHRAGDRVRVPLYAYAWLELLIAIATAGFTFVYLALPYGFAAAASWFSGGLAMDMFRVVTVFIVLLVPCMLMGATYPALCRALMHSAEEVDQRLGWIYGINTVGAALGATAAGFLGIEFLGARGSVTFANAINLLIAIGAFGMARRFLRAPSDLPEATHEVLPSRLSAWVTGVVLFGSGFATLGYEIIWFRALHYFMGSGSYVISAVLTIFLLGLGLGSFFYRRAVRAGRAEANLGYCQLAIAGLSLTALLAEQWVLLQPGFLAGLNEFLAPLGHWQARLAAGSVIAVVIVLPPVLGMGLAFPVASRLFLGSVQHLTARVGLAYLLSNLGSILGAILAAVWILPALGTVGGVKLFALINALLGFVILARVFGRASIPRLAAAILVLVALFLLLPSRLHFQPGFVSGQPGSFQLEFEEESDLGTVQVFSRGESREARAMLIDGTIIGGNAAWGDVIHAKQRILAHLPMSLDRNIRHTLNLGVATGSTVEALSAYPWVETLDAVEINPAVVGAAGHFGESRVFQDPRARLIVEDAIHYLLSTPRSYDLIVNDAKQDLRFSGSSKVLSYELYRYALDRLSECGLFIQFIPTVHSTRTLKLILRTFGTAFPEWEIFMDPPSSIMMVGSRCPIEGRERATRDELVEAGVAQEIEQLFLPDAAALPAFWVSSGGDLEAAIGEGPINDWDRLPLEFQSFRLPNWTFRSLANNLAFVQAGSAQASASGRRFGDVPYADRVEQLNLGLLRWYERDLRQARRHLREVFVNEPEFPVGLRVIELLIETAPRALRSDALELRPRRQPSRRERSTEP